MLRVSHLIVSHYSSMSLGTVQLLGEMLVQVLAEVSRWQERSFCSTFYLDTVVLPWVESRETHVKFHCWHETFHGLSRETYMEVPIRKNEGLHLRKKKIDAAALVLLIVRTWATHAKWELWHEREDLLTEYS